MTSYWILFSAIPLFWLYDRELRTSKGVYLWASLVLITILFVGLRHRVGCDWQDYFNLYEAFRLNQEFGLESLFSILNWGPSYLALNRLAASIGGGMYLVNLVCGVLAISGLAMFCRTLPSPWLGWAVAFPYFTTVVCMGYTRQSVAIGLFFAGLALLKKGRIPSYVLLIMAAGTFHVSAFFLLLESNRVSTKVDPYSYDGCSSLPSFSVGSAASSAGALAPSVACVSSVSA